jgi:hypothetical protein
VLGLSAVGLAQVQTPYYGRARQEILAASDLHPTYLLFTPLLVLPLHNQPQYSATPLLGITWFL